jgi:uncharacterized protein
MSDIKAPEQRTIDVDVQSLDTRGRTVVGYAAVYGPLSDDLGGYREKIAPGAFADVLDADVRALLNHDPSQVLGRTKAGTLRLHDEERGLRFEVDLPDSPIGDNVREAVRRGDIDGASFRFDIAEDDWQGELRTLKRIKALHDVTIGTYPAYPAASVELRTRPPSTDDQPAGGRKEDDVEPDERPGGGLQVEDRTAPPEGEQRTVEQRVVSAIRSINKGESRSLTVSNAEPIEPPEISTMLFDKLRPLAIALASGMRVHPTSNRSVTFPQITSDVDPSWVAAGEEIPEGTPGLAALEAEPKKLAHRCEIENEVLDDSEPSVQEILDQHLATMLALKLDRGIFEGNPAADPDSIRGLKFLSGIQEIVVGTGNGDDLSNYDVFVQAVGMLADANAPPPYVVATNPRTVTDLRLLKDETGSQRQLTPPADLPPFFTTTQISKAETIGTSSDSTSAYVYAPGQFWVIDRLSGEILIDRSRLFHVDKSEMRAKLRADFLAPNPVACVRVRGIRPLGS